MELHWDILSDAHKKLLPRLAFLKETYYLAGGTALALYFGHRTSQDFDFYSPQHFTRDEISNLLQNHINENDIITTTVNDDTYIGVVTGISISFFYYRYPLLQPLVSTDYLSLASLDDIAVMKLVAVLQRPAKRDYIDLYYLLRKYSIEKLFDLAKQKYPNFNPYLALRALIYFEDVEKEDVGERGIKLLDTSFSWQKAKEDIFEKVRKYQLGMFEKK